MTAIAVAAAKSSPGVSTVAELVARLGPPGFRPVLLDCDPAGSDWLLRAGVAHEPGLASLAMVARRGLDADELRAHLQHLGDGFGVLVAPAAARQAAAALDLVAQPAARAMNDLDVVVDCGCLFDASPAMPLVEGADLVVMVSHPTARAMVHLAPWVDHLRSAGLPVAVVLSSSGARGRSDPPYRPDEVAAALGVEVLGTMVHDADAAARLYADPRTLPSLSRSRLVRSMARTAHAAFARAAAAPPTSAPALPVNSEAVR